MCQIADEIVFLPRPMLRFVCRFQDQSVSDLDYGNAQERSLRRASVSLRRWSGRSRKATGPSLQLPVWPSLTREHPSSTAPLLLRTSDKDTFGCIVLIQASS